MRAKAEIHGSPDNSNLPISVIEDIFSLRRGKENIALSLCINISKNYYIDNYRLVKTIIKPTYSLTYDEADEILDYQPREEEELIAINYILTNIFITISI